MEAFWIILCCSLRSSFQIVLPYSVSTLSGLKHAKPFFIDSRWIYGLNIELIHLSTFTPSHEHPVSHPVFSFLLLTDQLEKKKKCIHWPSSLFASYLF